MKNSNQRITKIKKDPILTLLELAEKINPEDGTVVEPSGAELTPYPDMNYLRNWTRDNITKGINGIFTYSIEDDGTPNYTTLLDGLVLNTAPVKIVETTVETSEFIQPELTANGTIGGTSFAVEATSEVGGTDGMAFNLTNTTSGGRWLTATGSGYPQSVTYYIPNGIQLSSIDFKNVSSGELSYRPTTYRILVSNDNDTYTELYNGDWGSTVADEQFTCNVTSIGFYKYVRCEVTAGNNADRFMFRLMVLHGLVPGQTLKHKTTKPGLWLENLQATNEDLTQQYSAAGGYLRTNLINQYTAQDFAHVQENVIGNYAFSFHQRGIFIRDAGSTHYDRDSYAMQWSPSAESCTSFDSLIIPLMNLRNTYTYYSTLAVPSDATKSSYTETKSKDVSFDFVDNDTNHPAQIVKFNSRIVGDGWTYEFVVRGNGVSSGSSYEVDDDRRGLAGGSNGIEVEGSISYDNCDYLYDNGECTTCVQQINVNGITTQTGYNKDAIDAGATSGKSTIAVAGAVTTISTSNRGWLYQGTYNYNQAMYGCDGLLKTSSSTRQSWAYTVYGKLPDDVSFSEGIYDWAMVMGRYASYTTGGIIMTDKQNMTYPECGEDCICEQYEATSSSNIQYSPNVRFYNVPINWYSQPNRLVSCSIPHMYVWSKTTSTSNGKSVWSFNFGRVNPTSNQNIYLNLLDMKAEREAMGMPWNYDCTQDRFSVTLGTTPCTDAYCQSILLYQNVSIGKNGDINTALPEQTISNITV